jgi:hypothetical protein
VRAHHLAILVGLGIASCAGSAVHSFNSFDADPIDFTPDAWRKSQSYVESIGDPGCVLGGLAIGLKESGLLIHKQVPFVISQLGQPNQRSTHELVYAVGQCHGWGWHNSELVVHLSTEGTVQSIDFRASR